MKLFHPNLSLNNVFELDSHYLKERNIRGIIFDIDNTLAYNREEKPAEKVVSLLHHFKEQGFCIAISSNNTKERVEVFCNGVTELFVHQARKPLFFKTVKLFRSIGIKPKELCMVGDQLFTDMLGGNLFGLHTILVTPFDEDETKLIRWKRKLEKLILR